MILWILFAYVVITLILFVIGTSVDSARNELPTDPELKRLYYKDGFINTTLWPVWIVYVVVLSIALSIGYVFLTLFSKATKALEWVWAKVM